MERIAIFPGSFDPFTVGHEDMVKRGLMLFDRIIIGIGLNSEKRYFFSLEKRLNFIKELFTEEARVTVETFEGLTVNFAKEKNAVAILRGLRNISDFEYEMSIAQINRQLTGIETLFLLTSLQHTHVCSSIIRDILQHKGDVSNFIPEKIYKMIND